MRTLNKKELIAACLKFTEEYLEQTIPDQFNDFLVEESNLELTILSQDKLTNDKNKSVFIVDFYI